MGKYPDEPPFCINGEPAVLKDRMKTRENYKLHYLKNQLECGDWSQRPPCWLEWVEQLGKRLERSPRRKDNQCKSEGGKNG